MIFIWKELLWLLLLLPVLVWFYVLVLKRRKKSALRYANLAMVKAAMGTGSRWRRHVPPALLLLALGVLIIAVARPMAVVTLAASRATIILAMDTSGSMRAEDVDPNRIIAAQTAAKQFISEQPGDVEIGLVSFAGSAVLVQAPTIDRDALNAAIDRLELRRGTAVGAGLLVSLNTIFPEAEFDTGPVYQTRGRSQVYPSRSLDDPFRQDPVPHEPVEAGSYENAVIILLTDGATTTGPNPIEAGQMAADYGVRVFTVGFGSPAGEVVSFAGRSMRAQLDAESLKTIATTTAAQYFEARSSEDLHQVYRSMSSKLVTEQKLTEISFAFAGLGALLTMLAAGLSTLWYGRVF